MMHASGGAKFNFCKLSSNLCYQYVAAFKRYDRNSKNIGQAQPFLRWLLAAQVVPEPNVRYPRLFHSIADQLLPARIAR